MATMDQEEIRSRRAAELEALHAFYDNDLEGGGGDIPVEGPWFMQLRNANVEDDDGGSNSNSKLGTPTLEIRLPPSYPFGEESPEPILHNVMMKPQLKQQFLQELKDMYEAEMDVGILWGERCREELSSGEMAAVGVDEVIDKNGHDATTIPDNSNSKAEVTTFIPPTTRYSQPIRHFVSDVITDKQYERTIIHTPPFHPPKSGPSEIMIAHVCTVTRPEHVQWALAELLFNDKKVSKATHNMFAYRFTNADGTSVSDNDDDGEKGSGSKLAALLDMSNVDNVLVVVTRYFGGIHLGPSRFKWIARVARDGLVKGGFLMEGSGRADT